MQLNRKASGTWDSSRDSITQDLTTIQTSFNQEAQLVAALQAQIAAIQAQLAKPNIAISASGQVSGLAGKKNLQTVAHDFTLTGDGTPTKPLGAVPTTGTVSPVLYVAQAAFNFRGLATAPLSLVSGIPGATILPIWAVLESKIVGAGGNATNGSTIWALTPYPAQGSNFAWGTFSSMALGTNVLSGSTNRAHVTMSAGLSANNIANPVFAGVGQPLSLTTVSDISGGTNITVSFWCLYVVMPGALY